MDKPKISEQSLTHQSLEQFFQNEVIETAQRMGNRVPPPVQLYLANLLVRFAKSERVFVDIEGRNELEPLVLMLNRALEEEEENRRIGTLKHMGDVALYTSGLFSERIERGGVEVDYYIEMGGMAYSNVASLSSGRSHGSRFCELYSMLSEHFRSLVNLLWEFSDSLLDDLDATQLLALYHQWHHTGSRRLERRLVRNGFILTTEIDTCVS
jgi:hypothetical protein